MTNNMTERKNTLNATTAALERIDALPGDSSGSDAG